MISEKENHLGAVGAVYIDHTNLSSSDNTWPVANVYCGKRRYRNKLRADSTLLHIHTSF